MEKDVIINIPTGTRKNYDKPGLYVTNIIMQELSNLFELEQYYTFNVLDSFNDKEKYYGFYLNNIANLSLKPDKLLVDKDFDIIEYMDYLVNEKYITSKEVIHEICDCGRIDITEDFDNPRTKLFEIKDKKKICKICGSECKKINRESLVLKLKYDNNDLKVYPLNYKNSIEKQIDFFSSIDYLISKERDTGIKYNYNGKEYNIDVDFVNYLMVSKIHMI